MTEFSKSSPWKLLQVFNQYLEPGGEEEWVDRMLVLGEQHFAVEDIRFRSDSWIGEEAPNRLKQVMMLWDNPAARARLERQVEATKPDALLFHNLVPVASLSMYRQAADLGLPVLQYIHNFRPFSPSGTMWLGGKVNASALQGNPWPEVVGRGWEKSFFRSFLLAVYQRRLLGGDDLDVVRKWIAVSDFMRERFIEGGIPPERVVTLRHCWQTGKSPPKTSEHSYYLFLGRIVQEKGVFTLLAAWKHLEDRLGPRCPRLVLAGIGPEEVTAHRLASRMNSVTCVGYVKGDTKSRLIRNCRGLIAPSIWWEPLGLIVHEAYDSAKPVLAARSGGLTETVVEGSTGLLHEPGDAEGLARDVEWLEELGASGRCKMGEEGHRWLREHASPDDWRERFTEIIRAAAS